MSAGCASGISDRFDVGTLKSALKKAGRHAREEDDVAPRGTAIQTVKVQKRGRDQKLGLVDSLLEDQTVKDERFRKQLEERRKSEGKSVLVPNSAKFRCQGGKTKNAVAKLASKICREVA